MGRRSLIILELVVLCSIPATLSNPLQSQFETRPTSNVVWFPNPKHDGTFIPAKLDVSVHTVEFNESLLHFYVYTKGDQNGRHEIMAGDVESLRRSNIVKGAQLKLMVHGFGGAEDSSFPQSLKNVFLNTPSEAMNVITIDWEFLAESPFYFEAVENAKIVARKAADLLEFLIQEDVVTSDKIHMVGFSLGAQVVGLIGSNLTNPAARITGLDPARPLYDVVGDEDRLDPSDADFVDVIHTAGLTQAFLDPRGTVDFYPNGGATQPGCGVDITGSCAHHRNLDLMEESVTNPQGFRGQLCDSWEQYKNGQCINNEYAIMGYYTPAT